MAQDENNPNSENPQENPSQTLQQGDASSAPADGEESEGSDQAPEGIAPMSSSVDYVETEYGRVKNEDIVREMCDSFRDYAMSVIVDRALPDVRDGFKPVHRRVLFSMHELHNTFSNPTKKCARIVGDVIGKYHPHGDQAVYQTLVRLAQDFSMRYPLVAGQGNFGSIDGDGAAAMRYTECRLSQIADMMLESLDEETVDFQPNFDNSEQEPVVLPARIPNLLLNGTSGIAVGMATSIPPHNLTETVDACRYLLANPEATIDDLIGILRAPDFPTGGIIYGLKDVHEGYRTGRGRVVIRSHTHFETLKNGHEAIIVDDIPYMVNKRVLIESIALLAQGKDKKIEGIHDIRDESSKDVRIVIELKHDAFGEVVLNNLYKLTQMQSSVGINMVVIENRQPKLMNLRQIIEAFLRFRREVVTRRTQFRLKKEKSRGHILEGLAVALSNIDEFIALIKSAPNPQVAKVQIMGRGWTSALVQGLLAGADMALYRPAEVDPGCGLKADGTYWLSDIQADSILRMALQKLTGLEQDKINDEYREAHRQIVDLIDILSKPERVQKIIDDELLEIKAKYGDARKSEIDISNSPDFNPLDFVPVENVVVTMTRGGYVKRQSLTEYREQKRGGVGKKAAQMKEGDIIEQLFVANSHDKLLLFTTQGRVYGLDVYRIPEGSRTSQGRAIVNYLDLQKDEKGDYTEKVNYILPVSSFEGERYVFMATQNGTVKKTKLCEFANQTRKGKAAITLDEGDTLIGTALTDGKHDVMLFSDAGKALRFSEKLVRSTGRQSRGVNGFKLVNGAQLIALLVAEDEDQLVLTVCENGFGKCTPVKEYTLHGRNTQGMIAIAMTERNGRVMAATLVRPEDSVMLLSSKGILVRTAVSSIRVTARSAQGVKLIDLRNEDKLIRITRVADDDADEPAEGSDGVADAGDTPADSAAFSVEGPGQRTEDSGTLETDAAEGESGEPAASPAAFTVNPPEPEDSGAQSTQERSEDKPKE